VGRAAERRPLSVSLRPLEPRDATLLARWLNDPEVTREIEEEPTTEEEERAFIVRVAGHPTLVALGIVIAGEDRLVGWLDLTIDPATRSASFGIVVGERALWGRGIGGAATRLALERGFGPLDLERVELTVNVTNTWAIRAYERAGFRRGSVRPLAARREGVLVDELVMAVSRAEWLGRA
jgi:RimJ/RimL family protein N-acetyltransferase